MVGVRCEECVGKCVGKCFLFMFVVSEIIWFVFVWLVYGNICCVVLCCGCCLLVCWCMWF